SLGKTANCHINIDTGMNRLGINFRDCVKLIKKILELDYISIEGIFTHFSCASEKGDRFTETQWKRFGEVLKELRELKKEIKFSHCCNSAAFLKYRKMEMDMVRLGIAIYGLNPFSSSKPKLDLKPVLSLKSRITFIKKVAPGEGISYCSTFKTNRESIIATIPIGYADGYSRILSNKVSAIINGQFAPLVGNITMDQIMIDLTDIEGADGIKAGDEVILLGSSGNKRISAENLAELAETINYEIVCNYRSRIPRIFIN
ncbi:MAG: alanine racemase, partial [Candidatus Humimicrobiaceae bacterium]